MPRSFTRSQVLATVATLFTLAVLEAQTPNVPTPSGTNPKQPPTIPPLSDDTVVATVNGEKITYREVNFIVTQCPVCLTDARTVREEMIDLAVMRHYLHKQVPVATIQADIDREWRVLQAKVKKQGISWDAYLKQNGPGEEHVRRDLVITLQWKVLLDRRYTDEKLRGYYEANKVHFDQTRVRASHILIKVKPDATKEERRKAVAQLLTWREDILAKKATFADIARKHSECPSKTEGGDIGQFTYKLTVVPEFAKAAFALKKGELSEDVQTVFGIHLILVTDRKEGKASRFEEVKEAVRNVWAGEDDVWSRLLAEHRKTCEIKVHVP